MNFILIIFVLFVRFFSSVNTNSAFSNSYIKNQEGNLTQIFEYRERIDEQKSVERGKRGSSEHITSDDDKKKNKKELMRMMIEGSRIGNDCYLEYFGIDFKRMGIKKFPRDPFELHEKEIHDHLKSKKNQEIFRLLKEKTGVDLKEIIERMKADVPALYKLLTIQVPKVYPVNFQEHMFYKRQEISENSDLIERIEDSISILASLREDNNPIIKQIANISTKLFR